MTTQVASRSTPLVATLHHRKNIDKLRPGQLADLRRAFKEAMELSDQRGYWYFAGWHGQPFGWCEHHTSLFLPWHRAYLYYLELALQERVPGVTLPWWDWTASDRLPDAYVEDPAEGEPNPLAGKEYQIYGSSQVRQAPPRAPGAAARTSPPQVPNLPYKAQWDFAMEATSFNEFQARIEAIHDNVHVWVGGIMRNISLAAYDPLFYAHHVMVDRAWRLWQHRNPGATPSRSILETSLRPNGMKVWETLHVKRLGYEYAGTTSHVLGNVAPGGGG